MKRSIAHKLGLMAACGLAFAAPQASALTISADVSGNTVNIVASNMDNLISGFDILVLFGSPVTGALTLDPDNELLTAGGTNFVDFIDLSDDSVAGQASLIFNSFETDAALFAAQCPGDVCGPITLAKLDFADVSGLTFSFDWTGAHGIVCEQVRGSDPALARQCYPENDVPEPGTLALLGLGLIGLGVSRRKA